MAAPRRIGAETSKTRAALLDRAEELMLEEGYAAVTYRVLAARAGVTGGLVQYYFPTLDDLFLAMLERRSARNLERLRAALESRPDEPLRIAWEFSTDEAGAALLLEFMALANHRKTIRAAILDVIEQTRRAELDALKARWHEYPVPDGLSAEAMLFLLHEIPKMMLREQAVGRSAGHRELRKFVEQRLDAVEPRSRTKSRTRARRT
jgi:TetR/AcrR family transcriptional regulator, transcriptional repressor for nem operon